MCAFLHTVHWRVVAISVHRRGLRLLIIVYKTSLSSYSFARIPEILRDPDMTDTREIKILHSNETDDFLASYEADGSIDYFSASPDRVSN